METDQEPSAASGKDLSNTHSDYVDAKTTKHGHTSLMIACWKIIYLLIELFVEKAKADVNATDKDGDTAISLIMIIMGSNCKTYGTKTSTPIPLESVGIRKVLKNSL